MVAFSPLVVCANDGALPAAIAGNNVVATNNQRGNLGEAILRIDPKVRR
jgi:hypothetical protein